MIFSIKTLDEKAWKALVVGYDPPMITVSGVSILKPEVYWTDAKEQASVGNARALNMIFNGVDLNVFKLINSCSTAKEAWKTLEVAYEVTAIEEAHDITTLKLDELFGSLLTFEMAIADRESKKDKGISFKSTHVSEKAVSDTEGNMNESIDLLIKQFSNVVKKFKNLNTIGSNAPNMINYQRKDDEDTGDGEEAKSMNAFTVCVSETDSGDESECSRQICDKNFTFEELKVLWKEDSEARTLKSIKMLNSRTENLDVMLNSGQNGLNKYGLGFDAFARKMNTTTEIKFVPASVNDKTDTVTREKGVKIVRIRSNHGKEFKNGDLNNFCDSEGIHHEYSAPITSLHNGVVESAANFLLDCSLSSRKFLETDGVPDDLFPA
ncbi:gag-pol polyprotein [Cucumis melo var. makuwa]|uniref:Gag-pol polyprotein n=1 Tax=Cucumis melo var. makuwa TaxID=1194695 RepID=A0A5A7VJU3_CUCMM|nr:gag-pol polyprotein [Cucumis melo var. makuwa]